MVSLRFVLFKIEITFNDLINLFGHYKNIVKKIKFSMLLTDS